MKNKGVHQQKSLISQWPIAEENSKLDQIIARTMIYCHMLRYINHVFWQAKFSKFWWSTSFDFLLFSQFFET